MEIKNIIPEELRFAVTRKCNGTCRHCYNHSGKNIDRLSSDDFIQILKEVRALNPNMDRITLTGGEPLNEKEKVLSIARVAKSLGIRIRLVTRGWELNPEVCSELKEAGVTTVQIGLDSSGEFVYTDDFLMRWDTFHSWLRDDKEGFNKTVDTIKIALKSGMDVSVRYSLCRSNLNDVVKTYQFVTWLGVSKFKFRILFPDGRAKSRLLREVVSGEDMANAQFDLINASKGSKTIVEITQPCLFALPGRNKLPFGGQQFNAFKETCPCGTAAAYIDANGDIKYCLFDEKILGNVFDNSFLAIWNSGLANQARRQRCFLDESGSNCSSFKILYSQSNDFHSFMKEYSKEVNKKNEDNMPISFGFNNKCEF
jgi:MoaA/NifB/PqqE/SkfB family radical SAM enzyme